MKDINLNTNSAVLDYDERLILLVSEDIISKLQQSSFYKIRLKSKVAKIDEETGTFYFRENLVYLDFQKIDLQLKTKLPGMGIAYECTEMNSSGGATGNCSIKNGIITTTSELKMPNDLVSYTITLTNEGTIPALLKTATSPNNIEVDGYITGKAGDQSYYDANSALGASYYINYDGERLLGDTMVEEASIMLEPNESITVVVNHGWVDLGENQPVMPENGTSISYDISFGFEQSTAN